MTLINFSERSDRQVVTPKTILLLAAAIMCAVAFVNQYNATVDLRHDIADAEERIDILSEENAESKVDLLALISPENLDEIASERNLIKEEKPRYFSGVINSVARSGE